MSKIFTPEVKAYWLAKLRALIIVAGVFLFFAGARVIVAWARQNRVEWETVNDSMHPERYNEDLTKIEGSGLVRLMENENLAFAVDFSDGNIELTNKRSGYTWRSKPTPEEMEIDESNNLWQNIAQTPVYIEYIHTLNDSLTQMAHKGLDGYKVDIYAIPGGIRVDYQYSSASIAVALDYYLHDDHLEVDLPNYMLREAPITYTTEAGRLVRDRSVHSALVYQISILPFFGASQNRDINGDIVNGFMMVPDGPGGLIHFDENRNYMSIFRTAVYGNDWSFYSLLDNTMNLQRFYTPAFFPVFGVNHGDESLFGIVHYGESTAVVMATPSGMRTSFNYITPVFAYRVRYIRFHNLAGAGTMEYTESPANTSRNIRYYALSGDDADYVGMAKAYRDYLEDTKGFTRRPSNGIIPMELTLYGGDREDSFLVSPFLAMTTFEQGEEIVQFFSDNGVSEMNITYDGWYRNGNSVSYPRRFPPARQLGGERGLKDFVRFAHDKGFKVFLADWNLDITNTRGIVRSRDVVYDVQDTPLNWGTFLEPMYVLNTEANNRIAGESIKEYKNFGIDGITEFGATYLMSNQNSSNRMHREQVKDEVNALYQRFSDELGGIRIWQGMAFALVDGATIVDPAARYSFSPLVNQYVPIYYIAHRGLFNMVTIPVNTMSDPSLSILRAAEYGSNLSFQLTHAPTKDLFYAWNSWFLTSSQFDSFKYEFLDLYHLWNDIFGGAEGKFIENHEQIADDVFRTTFEGGMQIIANYRDADYFYEGMYIPSRWFAVNREGGLFLP